MEPTSGLEPPICRFQIGTFGLDVLCLERAVLEFQITIEQLGDFAGRALAQRSPYKPTHLRTVIRTAKKSRYVACSMQSYRVPTECTQADGPVKSSVFAAACGSRRPTLHKCFLGIVPQFGHHGLWVLQTTSGCDLRTRPVLKSFPRDSFQGLVSV
jgi:hypothetical protein